MEPQALDYAGVYSKLMELVGEQVEIGIKAADGKPPMLAYTDGELRVGGEIYAGEKFGLDPDALSITVGELMLTLHPDHFVQAVWKEDDARRLVIVFGGIALEFRAHPAVPSTDNP